MAATIHHLAAYRRRDPACIDYDVMTDPDMPINRRIRACDRLLQRPGVPEQTCTEAQETRARLLGQVCRSVRGVSPEELA